MQANVPAQGVQGSEGEGAEGVWHVAHESCRVHQDQSSEAPVAFVLLRGTYVTVAAREGNWVKISEPIVGFCTVWDDEGHQVLEKGDFSTVAKFRYRVVCRDGAYVRRGVELTSELVRTVPQGGVLEAYRKIVNSQGLTRLFVGDGWISEELNPLSGQRGPIVELIPLPSPIRYLVVYPEGCVVRTNVELLSAYVRTIPAGEEVVVVQKAWSESPPLQRLKLANGGWISLKLNKPAPDDVNIVIPIAPATTIDPLPASALPNFLPNVTDVQQSNGSAPKPSEPEDELVCIVCLEAARNATLVHGETGHIACCLTCARILKARGDPCPVCRVKIDLVIQHFMA